MLALEPLVATFENQHLVQFFSAAEDELIANVSLYFAEGYKRGSSLLVVATQAHRSAVLDALRGLGVDVDAALASSHLRCLDAQTTLDGFMTAVAPDAAAFAAAVGREVRDGLARAQGRGLRAYGEMVGILWAQERRDAAIALERLWDGLLEADPFTLYCGYPIDVFEEDFNPKTVDGVLCAHSHVLPASSSGDLVRAVSLAMDHVLGATDAAELRRFAGQTVHPLWADVPRGEAMILWLRLNLPERAERIVSLARTYYASV